jgi:hypothetical protein
MKHLLCIALGLLFSFNLIAQDQIITREGDIIDGQVVKIGITEIEYKKAENLEGPIYTILKNDVLSIKYENGTVEKFELVEEPAPVVTAPPASTGDPSVPTNEPEGAKASSPYRSTFRVGYSRFILKSLGGGSAGANTFTIDFETRSTNGRSAVRYPFYLTMSNGFYSIATGVNVKIFTNNHPMVRGFAGPEFTIGYVTGQLAEATVGVDFGVDINPIERLNIAFHPTIGYYVITDFSNSFDAMIVRINLTVGVNF